VTSDRSTRLLRVAVLSTALSAAITVTGCAWNPAEVQRSNTYAGNVIAVDVEVDSYDVRIVGSDRPDIQVDRTLRYTGGREPDERIDHHDSGVLAISTRCSRELISISACGGTYQIRVPHGTRVKLANGTSSVSVEDTRGDVDLHSDEGAIDLAGHLPTVQAATGTGAIRMNLTDTDRVRAKSDEGEVTVTGSVRSVETTTGVGTIRMDLTNAERVIAQSDEGEVAATGGVRSIEARTGVGPIRMDLIGGAQITGHSDEGDLALTTTGPVEALTASTGVGDITVIVPTDEARYDVQATTGTGRSIVEVPEATGGAPLRASSGEGNITIRPSPGSASR
jgi:DUF4097 and DUF4098 domain-containing protein YvlB